MDKIAPMKVDAWVHCLPAKYKEAIYKVLPEDSYWQHMRYNRMWDEDMYLRVLDRFESMVQVLSIQAPPVEMIAGPKKAAELARIANDGMAELIAKHRNRFISAIALLPMNDMNAALKETERAIKDLRFRGVYIFSTINDKPLDSAEFEPLYEKMSQYNLPIFLHPIRLRDFPDYKTEKESKYRTWHTFGWPYSTSVALTRLVFSGMLEKYPKLKIVAHHNAGFISFLHSRIREEGYGLERMTIEKPEFAELTKDPLDYFREQVYTDCEIRSVAALMCTYEFFGAEHILFGSGMPHGLSPWRSVHETVEGIEGMRISDEEKQMIFSKNAIKLLRLAI